MILLLSGKIVLFSVLPALILLSIIISPGEEKPLEKRVLFRLFAGGAVILIPAAFVVNTASPFIDGRGLAGTLLSPFIAVALVEEMAKWTVVRFFVGRSPLSLSVKATMKLSAAAAIGFAAGENILYLTGTAAPFPLMILRGLTALPLHALCGALMGFYMARNRIAEKGLSLTSLLLPVCLHGLYNSLIRLSSLWPVLILPLLAGMFFFLVRLRNSQENY